MATSLVAVCAVSPSHAQSRTGAIAGVVRDDTGGVLPGVFVTVSAPGINVYESALSDTEGRFVVSGLPAGAYLVVAELTEFATVEQDGVEVRTGSVSEFPITLRLAARDEAVVVTGSRRAEMVRHAPAAVSVVESAEIGRSQTSNYADVLRPLAGVNAIQLGARDVSVTPRTAAGVTARSTLVLVDGRPVTQPYFGAVFWDLLSIDPYEIDQIEVVRGPGSAVWGANALTGVVNIVAKSPQELAGTRVRIRLGELSTQDLGVVHAGGTSRLGYKVSASLFSQDAWERPSTQPDGTPIPPYGNLGTDQVKTHVRVDLRPDAETLWIFDGGFASSDGVLLTGLGPFDTETLHQGNLGTRYRHGDFGVSVSLDAHEASYVGFLSSDTVAVTSQTVRAEAQQRLLVDRHMLSLGGTISLNHFDFSLTPDNSARYEVGAFVEDEIAVGDRVRVRAGGRLDWFSTFGATFSPRVGVVVEPISRHTLRASYSRAYIAPSLLESFLFFPTGTTLGLPTGSFRLSFLARGSETLSEEVIDAYEIGYTGAVGSRATLTASVYRQKTSGLIDLLPSNFYSPALPPPGWLLPTALLATIRLPSELTYVNGGAVIDRGLEVGLSARLRRGLSAYANYAFQDVPEVEADVPLVVNRPSRHAVHVGASVEQGRLLGDVSVSFVGEAFWSDVQTFSGITDGYGLLNAGIGVRMPKQRATLLIKANNLTDRAIQQHIFGDILRRRLSAELQLNF